MKHTPNRYFSYSNSYSYQVNITTRREGGREGGWGGRGQEGERDGCSEGRRVGWGDGGREGWEGEREERGRDGVKEGQREERR